MKFGKYLHENKNPDWRDMYLDYDALKKIIKSLEQVGRSASPANTPALGTSLSVARPTNAKGVPETEPKNGKQGITQEQFYSTLENEMKKIDVFTKKMVTEIRSLLKVFEEELSKNENMSAARKSALQNEVDAAAQSFLRLEKYVNLNFTGFHKILKKHDKRLPNPCKAFYISRLHEQSWVKGDHSDVIVLMSSVYSTLRGDEEVEEQDNEKQDFVRTTTKYWVHTENISRVKYIVLQHLPVFLQKGMGDTDAQLVNSVYLDNRALELYHGRLDKTPGAIALRMRWYGTATPETVFVERKTHRDAWTGEVSVKERFVVKEEQVPSILSDTFDYEGEVKRMEKKGKKQGDIEKWHSLASECIQAINSKQLEPTMRTQYMRTAFQIPFDATVRVSLDTNLCMIMERTEDVISGSRWYRDPNSDVPKDEITRFPHAVLEIKLQLQDANATPDWVQELIESGMLMQVHKFSKFIHGCATLIPEDVQAVPYWIDDPTLTDSIIQSGAEKLLEMSTGANEYYQHLIPHDELGHFKKVAVIPRSPAMAAKSVRKRPIPSPSPSPSTNMNKANTSGNALEFQSQSGYGSIGSGTSTERKNQEEQEGSGSGWRSGLPSWCWEWASQTPESMRVTPQKVEPKLFLANERTFMKWLHMAVIMSSASVGVLAFTPQASSAQTYALLLLPVAFVFVVYPLFIFIWRNKMIRNRDASRWDDPWGPLVITVLLIFSLCIQFILKVMTYIFGS